MCVTAVAPVPPRFWAMPTRAPGTWQSDGGGVCYWARLSGFSGRLRDIKDNDNVAGPAVVTIEAGDQGFYSHGCGTWTKIN